MVKGMHTMNRMFQVVGASILTQRNYRRGDVYQAYVRPEFSTVPLQHPVLEISPDSLWSSTHMRISLVYLGCVYRPPSLNNFVPPSTLRGV